MADITQINGMKSTSFWVTLFLFRLLSPLTPLGAQPVYSWGKIFDLGNSFEKSFLKSDLVKIDEDSYVMGITTSNPNLSIDRLTPGYEGGFDVCLLVFDRKGNVTKVKSISGKQNDELGSIASNSTGELLVAINIESNENKAVEEINSNPKGSKILLLKLDSKLEVLWSRSIHTNADVAKASIVKFDREGNAYLGIAFNSDELFMGNMKFLNSVNNGTNDIFIGKFNAGGDLMWGNTFGGDYEDFVKDIEISDNGLVFFGGQYLSSEMYFGKKRIASNGQKDIYLAKLNHDGVFLNAYGYGSELNDDLRDIEISSDGNIFITGYFQGKNFFMQDTTLATKSKGNDFYLACFNRDMKLKWTRTDGNLNSIVPYHVKLDDQSNIYVHGRFDSPDLKIGQHFCSNSNKQKYSSEIWISKWDSLGHILWSKSYGGKDWEIEGGFLVEGEDSFILTGNTESATVNFGTSSLSKSTELGQFLVRFDKYINSKVNPSLNKTIFNVFPSIISDENPEVKIIISNEQENNSLFLHITNQFGNKIFNKDVSAGQSEFNFSFFNLPSGLYFATLLNTAGAEISQKIIKK